MKSAPTSRDCVPVPLFESESTDAQKDAEIECEPYFVDLETLPQDQLDHLRQTGLLSDASLEIQLLRDKHAEYLSQVWMKSLGCE